MVEPGTRQGRDRPVSGLTLVLAVLLLLLLLLLSILLMLTVLLLTSVLVLGRREGAGLLGLVHAALHVVNGRTAQRLKIKSTGSQRHWHQLMSPWQV